MTEKSEATDAAVASVQSTMNTFIRTAHVDHVYGDPVQHGDTTIIPAAEVLVGMGFAAGFGSGEDEAGAAGRSPGLLQSSSPRRKACGWSRLLIPQRSLLQP